MVAAAFFLLVGGTGALLALASWLDQDDPEVPKALQVEPIPLAAALKAAETHGGEAVGADFSRAPDEPWRVQLTGLREVWLSPGGETLEVRSTAGNKVIIAAFYLHTGKIAGRFGETFMTLVGLAMTGMVGTGLMIWPWLVRRRKKRGATLD